MIVTQLLEHLLMLPLGGFVGNMGNNAWTWIVVGIVVLAIIALIWYYSTRQSSYNNHDDE